MSCNTDTSDGTSLLPTPPPFLTSYKPSSSQLASLVAAFQRHFTTLSRTSPPEAIKWALSQDHPTIQSYVHAEVAQAYKSMRKWGDAFRHFKKVRPSWGARYPQTPASNTQNRRQSSPPPSPATGSNSASSCNPSAETRTRSPSLSAASSSRRSPARRCLLGR